MKTFLQRLFRLNNAVGILTLISSFGILGNTQSYAQSCPLGNASTFSVLGGSAVTNTNPTILVGDLGVSPGTSITGLSGITITGSVHKADSVAALAQTDSSSKYLALAALPVNVDLTGMDLGGKTLTPGVYHFNTSAQLTGALTLDTLGDPQAVFVFQIGSTLTTAVNSSVTVIGGPDANIFWQIGSSATLGTGTRFAGNILALASITITTGASIQCGSALAQGGAVTMDNNLIISCSGGAGCPLAGTPTPTPNPTLSTPVPARPTVAVPVGCVGIPASGTTLETSASVYKKVKTISSRYKLFAAKARSCGNSQFKLSTSNTLLSDIESKLYTSFGTTQISCSGTICEYVQTTEDTKTLKTLIKRLYLLQVKSKLGAINSCPKIKQIKEDSNKIIKDSKYYFSQALQTIKGLPLTKFSCR